MGSNLDKLRQANNRNITKTKQLQHVNLIDTVIDNNTTEEVIETADSNEVSVEKPSTTAITEKSVTDSTISPGSSNVDRVAPIINNETAEVPSINNLESFGETEMSSPQPIPNPQPIPGTQPMPNPQPMSGTQSVSPYTQMPTLDNNQYNMLYSLLNQLPSQQTGVQYNAFKQSTQFTPEKEEYRKNIQDSVSQWSSIPTKGKRVKNKILSIRVYPEIYDRIEMIALQNNCSLNEVMNILLAQIFDVDID